MVMIASEYHLVHHIDERLAIEFDLDARGCERLT